MSGHSRWSQIKRKKGKADVQRGKLFSKILREITVAAKNADADKIAEDDLLEKALDAGATDVRRVEKIFEITTAPAQMDAVRDALARTSVPITEAQVTYVPQSTVRVEGKDATSVVKLIEALEELDDVQHVYANYDIPDEVLEAISAA